MDEYINQNLPQIDPQKLWRYVDDILIITTMNKMELQEYVNNLNKIKGKIKFTMEFEENDQINFLDTTLKRNETNNQINTRWYRKEMTSNKLLNYNSHHHSSIKKNIVQNMTTKIQNTSRNSTEQNEDIDKLIDILKKSEYPEKEIHYIIKTAIAKNTSETTTSKNDTTKTANHTITLPYTT